MGSRVTTDKRERLTGVRTSSTRLRPGAHSKRTSANKVLKVYYGPHGETVRSRTTALAICALYGKVKA